MIVKIDEAYRNWDYWKFNTKAGDLLLSEDNVIYLVLDTARIASLDMGEVFNPEDPEIEDKFIKVTSQYQLVPIKKEF